MIMIIRIINQEKSVINEKTRYNKEKQKLKKTSFHAIKEDNSSALYTIILLSPFFIFIIIIIITCVLH